MSGVRLFFFTTVILPVLCFSQNVGINTANPEQKLHIGGPSSTMRVDAFNSVNNHNNMSSTNTAPVYIDHEGVLTLEFVPYFSGGMDDFDGNLNSSNVLQPVGTNFVEQQIYSQTVTVNRTAYIQINYSMSFSVEDGAQTTITDGLARLVQTYIKLGDGSRKYGMVAQCYINGSTDGAKQVLFNSGSAYILVPPGTHTINFYGGVGSGSTTESTYVNFGLDQDMLLMRLF